MAEPRPLEIHVLEENGEIMPGFRFEAALFFLKEGKRVARAGWNGKGMWLIYIPSWSPACDEDHRLFDSLDEALVDNGEEKFTANSFVAMKTADEKLVPWLCSQTDMLAYDWEIVTD